MKIEGVNKRRLKEFGIGTLSAAVYFLLWGAFTDYVEFTWQMAVVSVVFGLFTLLMHYLMSKGKGWKRIACIVMAAAVILGILWLVFVFNFHLEF